MGGAAEIHPGIDHPVPAIFAAPGGFVFKELDGPIANRAGGLVDVAWFPITAVLARAFHFSISINSPQSSQRTQRKTKVNMNRKPKGKLKSGYFSFFPVHFD
jgi:hypothetical protein